MTAKIVMLYLTVYSCDTGAVLTFQSAANRLEDCRKAGVGQLRR